MYLLPRACSRSTKIFFLLHRHAGRGRDAEISARARGGGETGGGGGGGAACADIATASALLGATVSAYLAELSALALLLAGRRQQQSRHRRRQRAPVCTRIANRYTVSSGKYLVSAEYMAQRGVERRQSEKSVAAAAAGAVSCRRFGLAIRDEEHGDMAISRYHDITVRACSSRACRRSGSRRPGEGWGYPGAEALLGARGNIAARRRRRPFFFPRFFDKQDGGDGDDHQKNKGKRKKEK